MANITWMNTPIPDIGNTRQQGIRTAADLFGRAATSASAGVAGLQAVEEAERAAQTQAADKFVLEKMLSTQDPVKYEQMRRDGSLLGPAMDQASNSTLLAAEARGGQLYNQARERGRHQELQAAERVWDEAVKYATSDPDKAQEILAGARFTDASDSATFAKDARKLFVPPDKSGTEAARKERQTREAYTLAEKVMSTGSLSPEKAASILGKHPDPLVRGMAVDRLTQLKQDTTQYYGPTPASNPLDSIVTDGGSLSRGVSDGAESALYKQFGNNLSLGRKAAGPSNPDPGSQEWNAKNGGREPSQADIIEWGNTYVLPASKKERGPDKGTTAIGPAQIVNSTRMDIIERFGNQLFGTSDPRRIPYTLENEDKIAEQIYKESAQRGKPGSPWQATQNYAGFKDLSVFKGVSWDEAKPLIHYIEGGAAPRSFRSEGKQIEARLEERRLGLSEGAKVILNAREKGDYGLSQAVDEVSKVVGKDAKTGDIRQIIQTTMSKAKESGTELTHAEAAGLLLNAISDDGDLLSLGIFAGKLPTISDLSDDLDLEESKLIKSAKELGNARADLKSYEKLSNDFKRFQELQEQYKKDASLADKNLIKAESSVNAGGSALAAFRKWQDTSDQMRKLIAPRASTGVNRGLVDDVRTAATQGTALGPVQPQRPPDIDLMLSPPQRGAPFRTLLE